MQTICLPAPAKLNLFLHIVGQRADGYHLLESLFQFLDFGDQITLSVTAQNTIELTEQLPGVATQDNLLYRAAMLLKQHTGCRLGAQISIDKKLAMGGGLGGGSSNAATVLLGLNYLWQLNLSLVQLAELGLQLGADVPIFVYGKSAFAQGIGEILTPMNAAEVWYLVAKPECHISTPEIFKAPELTRNTPKLTAQQLATPELVNLCHNDCQPVVINRYPEVANLLARLVEYAPSRMTGTGACVFSRFDSKQQAFEIQQMLPDNISSFVAKGINVSPLHQALAELNH